jgi:hypothetical protein
MGYVEKTNNQKMTIKTILLPAEKSVFIQENATKYGCNVIDIESKKESDKITVTGEDENIKRLFNQIGE